MPEGSLLCLEIRCGAWRVDIVSGDSLWCLKGLCCVWRFAVLPDESLWCLEIRSVA